MINECTTHKTYMSGIRFIFDNKKNNETKKAMFSLKCNAKTGEVYGSWVLRVKNSSSGKFEDVADIDKPLQVQMGTRVPVFLQLHNNTVTFKIGSQFFVKKLDFDVKDIELIGIGSKGIARFFDEELIG